MEFILQSQARAEVRMEKSEARAEKAEVRMDRMDARIEKAEIRSVEREKKLDRRMDAITKLIQQGMKTLSRTQGHLDELAQAQKETERTLKAFIASSRNGKSGRNGH